MKYMGIDLHKKIIVICIVNSKREVQQRKKFYHTEETQMKEFFKSQKPFTAAFEATAAYEWFYKLLEPYAKRVVLVHPKKMRIIAESRSKSDKVDAQMLAEYLAMDHLPEAYRPSPYVQGYRRLVRLRHKVKRQITSVKNRIHNILANYNKDRKGLFTQDGWDYIMHLELEEADRFAAEELWDELIYFRKKYKQATARLKEYVKKAPARIQESRAILKSMKNVGDITIDVVISELDDIERFSSQKKVCAYAGLDPGQRQSADHRKELSITKQGSRLLRWVLVQAAWRMVGRSEKWRRIHERIKTKTGNKKKAIVAVARRILCTMVAMLKTKEKYQEAV